MARRLRRYAAVMDQPMRDEKAGPTDPAEPVAVPERVDVHDVAPSAAPVAGETPVESATAVSGEVDDLERTIQAFLSDMGTGVVSVSRVVNPLLQVWSVARNVDAVVAVPVENLLTVLVGRSLTTSQELTDTMTEVRAVLAGTRPLATV